MHLRNYVLQHNTLTAAEIHAALTTPRRVRLPVADATWSIAGLAERLGVAAAEAIYQAVIGAGLHGIAARLASVGLDTGDPQWSEYVDTIGAAVPELAEHLTALRDIGHDTRPPWEVAGMSEAPTVEEIEAVQATIASEELREEVASRYQRVRDAMDAGEVLDIQAAITLFGEKHE